MRRALPLRIKLTALLLILLTGGLAFIGAISISMLHSYLLQWVDHQIDLTPATTPVVVPADTVILRQGRDDAYKSLVPVDREVGRLPKPRIPATTNDESRTVPADRSSNDWRGSRSRTAAGAASSSQSICGTSTTSPTALS